MAGDQASFDLRAAVREWVDESIITQDQAGRILARELDGSAHPEDRPRGGLPIAAEILAYLGSSLALVAAGVVVAQYWDDLQSWARVALVGLATGLLLFAGFVVRDNEGAAWRRLTGFLWLLSAGAGALTIWLVLDDPVALQAKRAALVTAAAATGYAGILWRLRPAAVLQQVAFFGGLIAAVGTAVAQPDPPPLEFIGLAIWGAGVAWVLLAWGRVNPLPVAGYALGAIAAIFGMQTFSIEDYRVPGLTLGLLTAAALVVGGVVVRQTWLLGLGAAGVFLFVPQAVFEYFGDTLGAPIALFVTGVILLLLSLVIVRARSRIVEEGSTR